MHGEEEEQGRLVQRILLSPLAASSPFQLG